MILSKNLLKFLTLLSLIISSSCIGLLIISWLITNKEVSFIYILLGLIAISTSMSFIEVLMRRNQIKAKNKRNFLAIVGVLSILYLMGIVYSFWNQPSDFDQQNWFIKLLVISLMVLNLLGLFNSMNANTTSK